MLCPYYIMNSYVRMFIWMGITGAMSFLLIHFFGIVIGLAFSFGIFILLNVMMRRRSLGANTGQMNFSVTYRCIACGHKFKGGMCPRCGSKMRKPEF